VSFPPKADYIFIHRKADGVGRSWAVYCWDSPPSLYTFCGNVPAAAWLGIALL
jgi:hypothetical protein